MAILYSNNELTQPSTKLVKWEFVSMETKGIYRDWEEMPEDLYQLPDEEYEQLTSEIGMQVTWLTFKYIDGRNMHLDRGSVSIDRKKTPNGFPQWWDDLAQALLKA